MITALTWIGIILIIIGIIYWIINANNKDKRQNDYDSEKKWRHDTMKIKQKNFDLHSLRCDLGYKLDIAREFINDVDVTIFF